MKGENELASATMWLMVSREQRFALASHPLGCMVSAGNSGDMARRARAQYQCGFGRTGRTGSLFCSWGEVHYRQPCPRALDAEAAGYPGDLPCGSCCFMDILCTCLPRSHDSSGGKGGVSLNGESEDI